MNWKVYALLLLVIAFGGASSLENVMTMKHDQVNHNSSRNSMQIKTEKASKWISQLFQDAERAFDMSLTTTEQCIRDFETYKMHLKNQSVWAVRMMESSEWPVVGVFYGQKYHLGNWRECLLAQSSRIKGQYCLASSVLTINFKSGNKATNNISEWVSWPDGEASAWDIIEMYGKHIVRVDRLQQNWALCIPSTCTRSDLTKSLNDTLYPIFKEYQIDIAISVDPKFCKTNEVEYYSHGYDSTMFFLATLTLLVTASTGYDVLKKISKDEKEKRTNKNRLLLCFSIKRNFENLTHSSSETYTVAYSIKFFLMCLVTYAHRLMYIFGSPSTVTEDLEMMYKPMSIELVNDGTVDVFFMISGFMTFHFGITSMTKGGLFYMVFSILTRWIKMIPTFGLLILFIIYILPHLGEGPLWDFRILKEVENCKENWWTNILAINNLVNPERQCLLVSYYIAVDIQLSILGAVLLFITSKKRKIGIIMVLLSLIVASSVTFAVVYINEYFGHLRLTMRLLEEPRNFDEFIKVYITTYSRVAPYIMGFAAGLIAMILKEKNIKFTLVQLYSTITVLTIIGYGFQCYAFDYFKTGKQYWDLENAIFATVHRFIYVVSYAFGAIVYITSGLAIFPTILERKIFIPLGRLAYCFLLCSFVLQLYCTASMKIPNTSSTRFEFLILTAGDIVFSLCISFIMYLMIEGPLNNIIKIIISSSRKPQRTV